MKTVGLQGLVVAPVSVIVPAYNEETGVAGQVDTIRQVLVAAGMTHEILVVDDGSEDLTAAKALTAGARVLRHRENRGYGAAIKTGILAAKYEMIVIIDADGTYPAEEIPALVEKLETADMVVGARVGRRVHIPWARRPAKWMLGWLAARIAGQPILDLNSGFRAFRRDCVVQYFPVLSSRFSFTTTATLALLGDDYRVIYHPIDYHPRIGKSKITPRHFMDFTILVLRMAALFQPLRVFVPLAVLFGGLGAVKVAFDIIAFFERNPKVGWSVLFEAVLSTSALLLLLVAVQMLLIGMVADGVLRRMSQQNRHRAPSHAVWIYEPESERRAAEEDVVVG